MLYIKVPFHHVFLHPSLATGTFRVAVCKSLPVEGIAIILGNHIAGVRVLQVLEALDSPAD